MQNLIEQIVGSSAFWGLVGTLSGSLGTWLTVRSQLKHSSKENKKERELSLRKQVYFDVCDSIAQMVSYLVAIQKNAISDINIDSKVFASIYRVHLISNLSLISKLNKCQAYFSQAYLDIIQDKFQIENISTNCKHSLEKHQEYLKLFESYTDEYKQNLSQQDFLFIKNEQEQLRNKMSACLDYHEVVNNELLAKQLNLSEKTVRHLSAFSTLLADCVISIRIDLENGFCNCDSEKYLNLIKDSGNKSELHIKEFLERVKLEHTKYEFPNL